MKIANFYATKLKADIDAVTSIIGVDVLPKDDDGVVITEGILVLEARKADKHEIIRYTGVDGTNLTGCTRGQGGTTATTHAKGSLVEMNATGTHLTELYEHVNAVVTGANQGWIPMLGTVTTMDNYGNKSHRIKISGNHLGAVSKGMRLKITRSSSVQTQVSALNGVNQHWNRTATINGMTFTDDFAVGAWVKLSGYAAGSTYIVSRYNGTSGWQLEVVSDGRITLIGRNGASANFSQVLSYQSLPVNKWVHITAQLDMSAFTATSTTSYIMFDGVEIPSTVNRGGTNPTSLVQAGNLEIGSNNGGIQPFNGKIAQAWIASAKITQANIRSFMNAPLTAALCATHNIISAYAFDGNGNDINTTNANNLTAQNAATATNADSPFNANVFAIVMTDPVYTAPDTYMVISTPEGYPLPNTGLDAASYSSVKAPYGFPSQRNKWEVMYISRRDASQFSSVIGTWYNIASANLNIPAGAWKLDYMLELIVNQAAGGHVDMFATLSTTTNSEADIEFTVNAFAANTIQISHAIGRSKAIELSSATPYYLLSKVSQGTSGITIYNYGPNGPTIIRAENAYL